MRRIHTEPGLQLVVRRKVERSNPQSQLQPPKQVLQHLVLRCLTSHVLLYLLALLFQLHYGVFDGLRNRLDSRARARC